MIYDGANFGLPPINPGCPLPPPSPIFQQYQQYDNYPPSFPQNYGKQAQPGLVGQQQCRPGCGFNKSYLFPLGLIRLIIILFILGGLIAAVAIPLNQSLFYLNDQLSSTRTAYLVICSVSISYSILIYIISITNFVNIPGIQSILWLYAFTIYDAISFLILTPIGIAIAVGEAQAPMWLDFWAYRTGTFAAAAAFGLAAALLSAFSCLIEFMLICRIIRVRK